MNITTKRVLLCVVTHPALRVLGVNAMYVASLSCFPAMSGVDTQEMLVKSLKSGEAVAVLLSSASLK